MQRADVENRVLMILLRDFKIDASRVVPEATFRGTLGMDSLDAVDLVFLLCAEFGLKKDLHPWRGLNTFAQVVDFLIERGAENPPTAS